jgi:acyl carrier protein phosphodiesterase
MNFLLHHHLAARDTGRPEAAAGAMLPDVWRMADRRARARGKEERRGEAEAQAVRSVRDGVEHHLSIDAWFHGIPVFERGERAAREALRVAREAPKMGLFAHVTWELCLDGALLRRVGTETVLRAVRSSIQAVRPDAHHRAADAWVALPTEERTRFDGRVDQILDAIGEGRWVAGYATSAGIVERLDGLRARLGFSTMGRDDREAVAAALRPLEHEADVGLQEILAP